MAFLDRFGSITQHRQTLAPHTYLRIGGPAEYLVTPQTVEQLAEILHTCHAEKIPLRVLGGGTNLLVRDHLIPGVVLRLSAPAFTQIQVEGKIVRAGGGATLASLISQATRSGLAGFETLVGITATVGGALRCNAGDRAGEMADHLLRVEVLDERGQRHIRERSELHFGDHSSDLEDPVILSVEFALEKDASEGVVKRMRRAWIQRKAGVPFSFQAAVRVFKNPRGMQASTLIDKAGLPKTRIGGAEVSERNGSYVVAHPGTTANDVLQLIDLVREKVHASSGIVLEQELKVW